MTVIKATCPTCGTVELTPEQVRRVEGERAWYSFECDTCGATVHKHAAPDALALLREAGVRIEHVPAEVWEPRSGPPLTPDDLLDLWRAMGRTDWLVRVVLAEDRQRGEAL